MIVACTGYKNTFPFAEETHPDINEYGQNPRLLYKQIFHPNYGSEVAYFGFARPAFGSIPPTSEMQSRFYSMVVNGDLDLPCKAKMEKVALEDKVRFFFFLLSLVLLGSDRSIKHESCPCVGWQQLQNPSSLAYIYIDLHLCFFSGFYRKNGGCSASLCPHDFGVWSTRHPPSVAFIPLLPSR